MSNEIQQIIDQILKLTMIHFIGAYFLALTQMFTVHIERYRLLWFSL